MTRILTILFFVCSAQIVLAHSPLQQSIPADQSVVPALPEMLALSFANPIRLTRVTFKSEITDPIDLKLSEVDGFETDYSIDLRSVQNMGQGVHRVEWRGLGIDGHAMRGAFEFTVTSP